MPSVPQTKMRPWLRAGLVLMHFRKQRRAAVVADLLAELILYKNLVKSGVTAKAKIKAKEVKQKF